MKRYLVVFVVLSLLLLILMPACGGGGEEKTTTQTPIQTTTVAPITSTTTATATATPAPTQPVKIGAVSTWSGPMAMSGGFVNQAIAVVEWQVNNMGGILGGREVQFFKGDDGGEVAQSAAQAKKLILEDKVSILTLGGNSVSSMTAVSDVAEEFKVPFVSSAVIFNMAAKKYTVSPLWIDAIQLPMVEFITDVLKPKTIAFLATDIADTHSAWDGLEGVVGWGDHLKSAGIDVVYREYFPLGTVDFSPYLTKIKYQNPDILAVYLAELSETVTINKQITELGGLGSTKLVGGTFLSATGSATKQPSAVGSYVPVLWMPGSDEPGMKAYEDAFKQTQHRAPTWEGTVSYNALCLAIKAIELAGTDDPGKVAEAMRSGNLEWDSAWGPLRIDNEGKAKVSVMVAQVQDGGKLVPVWTWKPE
jgi:branched-chain amino acid transport system substrate-binding protein